VDVAKDQTGTPAGGHKDQTGTPAGGQASPDMVKVSPDDVVPLDDENAKILRFIEAFNAEPVEPNRFDIQSTADGIVPPPF